MSVYSPPTGKCTNCDGYVGRPKTGSREKEETDFGEIFPSKYHCPVCSESTEWRRLQLSEMSDSELVELAEDCKFSSACHVAGRVERKVGDKVEVETWMPDYKK